MFSNIKMTQHSQLVAEQTSADEGVEREVALIGAELSTLELLSAALHSGADRQAMIAVADADGSLTALLGVDPISLSLEELQDEVEEKKDESKKAFWTKKKKAMAVGFASAVAGVAAAIVILNKMKRAPVATGGAASGGGTSENSPKPLLLTAPDQKPSRLTTDDLDRRNQSKLMQQTAKKALRPAYDKLNVMAHRAARLKSFFGSGLDQLSDKSRSDLINSIRNARDSYGTTDKEIELDSNHSFGERVMHMESLARMLQTAIVSLKTRQENAAGGSTIFDSVVHKEISTIMNYAAQLPKDLEKARGLRTAVDEAHTIIYKK